MNVYDTANKLAQEIKESQEYKEYKSMKDEIMTNPELKSKIEEFEKLRYDIQLMQYSGEQKDEGKMKKLEDMYKILIEDEQIKKYFDCPAADAFCTAVWRRIYCAVYAQLCRLEKCRTRPRRRNLPGHAIFSDCRLF